MGNEVTISRRYDFEAAHFLPNVPSGHKCRRMHGHSFVVEVEITGPIQAGSGEDGMVMDFDPIDSCWKTLWNRIDHTVLNETLCDNPTVENAVHIVHAHFCTGLSLQESSVRVVYMEGPRSKCTYPPVKP